MAQGEPTPAELDDMRGAMKRAMEDGAFGLSSALIYPPGEYTTTHELIELAKVMSPYGGVYITHMRSEADRLLEAIDEAIEIGRKRRRARRDLSPEGRRDGELAEDGRRPSRRSMTRGARASTWARTCIRTSRAAPGLRFAFRRGRRPTASCSTI